jgi:hypothetical protein
MVTTLSTDAQYRSQKRNFYKYADEGRFSEPLLISIPLLPRGLKYRLHANCTLRRFGERCTGEALVHCPKCGSWFCDAHAEDERWGENESPRWKSATCGTRHGWKSREEKPKSPHSNPGVWGTLRQKQWRVKSDEWRAGEKQIPRCAPDDWGTRRGWKSREEKSKSPHANPACGAPGRALICLCHHALHRR